MSLQRHRKTSGCQRVKTFHCRALIDCTIIFSLCVFSWNTHTRTHAHTHTQLYFLCVCVLLKHTHACTYTHTRSHNVHPSNEFISKYTFKTYVHVYPHFCSHNYCMSTSSSRPNTQEAVNVCVEFPEHHLECCVNAKG